MITAARTSVIWTLVFQLCDADLAIDLGLNEVQGYPATTPCRIARPEGKDCVNGQRVFACGTGLTCFRWKPTKGKCQRSDWYKNSWRRSQIYEASTGCAASLGPKVIKKEGHDAGLLTATQEAPALYLRQQGQNLLDRQGNAILLKGVNLGGWLVTENWMCGIRDHNDTASGRFVLETLKQRFGAATALELQQVWQDNFIHEADFERIASLGFNTVRIPFGYRNLLPNSLYYDDRSYPEVVNVDFSRLDWAVEQARKHDLYIIFDYHVWWGQHNGRTSATGHHGEAIRKAAYDLITTDEASDPSLQQQQREHAVEVWTAVIRHFKGNAQVAAFELLNEAFGGPAGVDFLYKALRPIDPERLFIVYGYPAEVSGDWSNVIYGPHLYNCRGPDLATDEAVAEDDVRAISHATQTYNVPGFVGEFHVFNDATGVQAADARVARTSMSMLVRRLTEARISWAVWTWKGVDVGDWAIIRCSCAVHVDAGEADADLIRERWQLLRGIEAENEPLKSALARELGRL